MHSDQLKTIKIEYQKNVKQMLDDYQSKIEENDAKHKEEIKKLKDFQEVF